MSGLQRRIYETTVHPIRHAVSRATSLPALSLVRVCHRSQVRILSLRRREASHLGVWSPGRDLQDDFIQMPGLLPADRLLRGWMKGRERAANDFHRSTKTIGHTINTLNEIASPVSLAKGTCPASNLHPFSTRRILEGRDERRIGEQRSRATPRTSCQTAPAGPGANRRIRLCTTPTACEASGSGRPSREDSMASEPFPSF